MRQSVAAVDPLGFEPVSPTPLDELLDGLVAVGVHQRVTLLDLEPRNVALRRMVMKADHRPMISDTGRYAQDAGDRYRELKRGSAVRKTGTSGSRAGRRKRS